MRGDETAGRETRHQGPRAQPRASLATPPCGTIRAGNWGQPGIRSPLVPCPELSPEVAGATVSPFSGHGVTCAPACELAQCTWRVGTHGWPGGLSAPGCPLPPFLSWLSRPHTSCPEPSSAELGRGRQGCGPDTPTGWEGTLAVSPWKGLGGPDTQLLREGESHGMLVWPRRWNHVCPVPLPTLRET